MATHHWPLITPRPPLHIPSLAEKVLQRGEKIELLVDKTEALSTSARRFQHQSKSLKNVMWWKNVKMVRAQWAREGGAQRAP